MSLGARALRLAALAEGQLGRVVAPVLMSPLGRRSRRTAQPVTGDGAVIVSLTSYGTRLQRVHYAIEAIAAGTVRPARLILWIDEGTVIENLPPALLRLRDRGLEIRPTPDIGPYKKIIPALAESLRPDGGRMPVVTADDDVLYPRNWLQRLLARAATEPGLVHCYRAREVVVDGDALAPYANWPVCVSDAPGFDRIATGVSGVYYPPALLDALAAAGDGFTAKAPRADDLWAHHTAVVAGLRVRQLSRMPRHFPEIPGTRQNSLYSSNLRRGANDPQIAAIYSAEAIARVRADAEARR